MANIGDILTTVSTGMQRIDDTNSKIIYNGDNWKTLEDATNYNNTLHYLETSVNDSVVFYFYGTKFNIIANAYTVYSSLCTINIDDKSDTINFSMNNNKNIVLVYKAEGMEKRIHKIEINGVLETGKTYVMNLDAIDIDDDGYLCTEDDYLAQENKEKEFPVKVAGDSITSEDDILAYAETLTNGEKYLLVSELLQAIYVSDGKGGMTKITGDCSSSGGTNTLSYFSNPNK